MLKNLTKSVVIMALCVPLMGFFKIKDTVFDPALDSADIYSLKSLVNINFKTNDLEVGPLTGTWKNKAEGKKGGLFKRNNRSSITEFTFTSEAHGDWQMTCAGEVKGFAVGGISFDRGNAVDYQCVMVSGDTQAVLSIDPVAKPKFGLKMGASKEERKGQVALPDGGTLSLASLHNYEGSKMEDPKPYGFHIIQDDKVIAAVGMKNQKESALIGAADADVQNIALMSAIGLRMFMTNDAALTR